MSSLFLGVGLGLIPFTVCFCKQPAQEMLANRRHKKNQKLIERHADILINQLEYELMLVARDKDRS